MTIYISKEINIQDYEVEIELEEDEVLGEMNSEAVLDYVIDNYSVSDILNKLGDEDIIKYVVKEKSALAALLRKIADRLDV